MRMHDELSQQNPDTMMLRRLDAHYAWVLGCDVSDLRQAGTRVLPSPQRQQPRPDGRRLPLIGLMPHGSGACILSCTPPLAPMLADWLAGLDPRTLPFDDAWRQGLQALSFSNEQLVWSLAYVYVTDDSHFRPQGVDPSVRVERLSADDAVEVPDGPSYDGPLFVVRDSRGAVVAWAAVRCSSDIAWEIEAATQPEYRARGLATVLTAMATAHVLSEGRLALSLAEADALPSRRLVERLGYRLYGEQFVAEVAPVSDQHADRPPA